MTNTSIGTIHTVRYKKEFGPFITDCISFIVIFCNAVQNADSSDLVSLSEFVTSLESCSTISEGANKLYKMCRLFLQVAKLYIQAKSQDVSAVATTQARTYSQGNPQQYYATADDTALDLNAMTQFDPYLSALGLMPNAAWPMGFSNAPTSAGIDTFAPPQGTGVREGFDAPAMGFGPSGGNQNALQDWFSGSRYLMNIMEAGDDLQMPDT